ncbi:PAS domain-containing sensor histidine kinase [Flexivirga caeni]|uniref:histidine kinase n=1 Tax=Flexivirga caeni TaxID=2294115 RepID=A0A3M9LYU5_9MICO|nr:PAS domain-containing sensor histidine kinase [Flexivirga caeni]RNI17783.1 PAS domain-containing protein [Flexivirga caeni]
MRRPRHQQYEPELALVLYQALLEQLPEGVVVADADHRLVLANQRAARLTGIPLQDRVGDDIRDALPLTCVDGRNYWAADDPWGGLHTRSGSPEQRLILSRDRSVLAATRHIRGGADRSLQWLVLTMRSTTVRDRVEAETAALVTTVAHELRSPLGAVRGFSQTLRTRWSDLRDDQKLWMVDAIEADAARLQRQVGDLLDISRIEAGRLRLRRSPVDLLALVRAVIERLESAGHEGVSFDVTSGESAVVLHADPDRLTQVLSNLLENAAQHGEHRVRVSVETTGDHVCFDVTDDGPGIAPEHRALVFSRFWQAKGRHGGNGLGLYVVQGLVRAHGGTIEVLDRRRGATFRVTLPVDGAAGGER